MFLCWKFKIIILIVLKDIQEYYNFQSMSLNLNLIKIDFELKMNVKVKLFKSNNMIMINLIEIVIPCVKEQRIS